MPYLGNSPTVGNFVKLDAISTVDGQATYNLTLDSTAFTPESANHMLVVVNGIVQSPTTNYTVSGSQITFTGNLVTGDVVNEIRVFGDVLNIGTPSDSTVTNAKTNFVSTSSAAGLSIKGDGTTDGTVQLNCSQNSHGIKLASPAHSAGQSYKLIFPAGNVTAGKFLKVDSVSGSGTTGIGTMTFGDAGVNPSSIAFHAHANANQSIPTTSYTTVTLPNEKVDTGSDFASNTFTVPTTGFYFFVCRMTFLSGWTGQYITKIRLVRSGSEVDSLSGYHYHNNTEEGDGNSGVMSCQASDEISFQVYQASGSSRNTYYGNAGGIFLAGFFLGTGA